MISRASLKKELNKLGIKVYRHKSTGERFVKRKEVNAALKVVAGSEETWYQISDEQYVLKVGSGDDFTLHNYDWMRDGDEWEFDSTSSEGPFTKLEADQFLEDNYDDLKELKNFDPHQVEEPRS